MAWFCPPSCLARPHSHFISLDVCRNFNWMFVSFHRASKFPRRWLSVSLETNLFHSAMMPGGSPATQTSPGSEPHCFLANLEALRWSRCGSAPSWGWRVDVNWLCQKELLSFLAYVKRLLFRAVVNLLKVRCGVLTVGVGETAKHKNYSKVHSMTLFISRFIDSPGSSIALSAWVLSRSWHHRTWSSLTKG